MALPSGTKETFGMVLKALWSGTNGLFSISGWIMLMIGCCSLYLYYTSIYICALQRVKKIVKVKI
jgi:hypothetical protein